MHRRCENPNDARWKHYGGRGIGIDPRWNDIHLFIEDMGLPAPKLTLDRIDNNGNYCKANCRWVPQSEQTRNCRRNRYLTARGKTQLLIDWARELGVSHRSISSRIDDSGWSVEDALTTPFVKGKHPSHPRRNREDYKYLTIKGVRAPLKLWAELAGVSDRIRTTLYARSLRGWSDADVILGRM